MSKASEWAQARVTVDARRPEKFSTASNDLGGIGAWVRDDGTVGHSIQGQPTAAMWTAFARWVLDTFGDGA